MTVGDMKKWYDRFLAPQNAILLVGGDTTLAEVQPLLEARFGTWKKSGAVPTKPDPALRHRESATTVYLVDRPGAPQSVLQVGVFVGDRSDRDAYYAKKIADVAIAGMFTSRVNLNLREAKGYTYGARSAFNGGLTSGLFEFSAEVKTEVTKESVVETLKELQGMEQGLKDDEVSFARDSLTQSMSRSYESIQALGGLIDNVARYNWPDDYPSRRLKYLSTVSREQLDSLAQRYLHPDTLHILVVGDAAKVRDGLKSLGYPMTELDIDGNPLPQG
jgi:zinc protease